MLEEKKKDPLMELGSLAEGMVKMRAAIVRPSEQLLNSNKLFLFNLTPEQIRDDLILKLPLIEDPWEFAAALIAGSDMLAYKLLANERVEAAKAKNGL